MGIEELEYMNWAANNATSKLRNAIESLTSEINEGVKSNIKNWPTLQNCAEYMNDKDEFISIMAAQMINIQSNFSKLEISQGMHAQMESLLIRSKEIH